MDKRQTIDNRQSITLITWQLFHCICLCIVEYCNRYRHLFAICESKRSCCRYIYKYMCGIGELKAIKIKLNVSYAVLTM